MRPEQRERVKQDLFEMLQLPQEAWSAALDAAGSADPVVRTEVERLLQLRTSLGHFLEGNAVRGFGLIDAEQLIGSRLKGRYLIEKFLGEGGFGVVFLASDSVLDSRPVVVKMLHPGVFTKGAVQKEIRSLAAIDHPGVVGILDAGDTDEGRFFLVLRYIAGPTLREVFNERGKLPTEQVERLTRQLTEALSICHNRNILHLDLKPENILLKDYGLPGERGVIVDFGTAETLGKTHAVATSPSREAGNQPYRAPELFQGEKPSAASDVYSLGVVIREALTGDRSARRGIPRIWRRLVARATNPNPAERYVDAALLQAAIPKTGISTPLRVGLALAPLALAAFLFHRESPAVLHVPAPVPVTSLPGEEFDPSLSPDGSKVFFAWLRQTPGESDIYVKDLAGGDPVRLTQDPARESHPVCSRDGKVLAFFRDRGKGIVSLILLPLAGGQEREIGRGRYHSMSWAPDNRSIAVSCGEPIDEQDRLRVLNIENGEWRDLTAPSVGTRGDRYPSFSPDGSSLLFARTRVRPGWGELFVQKMSRDLQPLGPAKRIGAPNKVIERPFFTPDGRGVVYSAGTASHKGLWYVASDGSAPPIPIPRASEDAEMPFMGPFNPRIVFARPISDMNIWRVTLSEPGGVVTSTGQLIASTRHDEEQKISPDGRTLAFVSQRTGDEQVWLADMDGTRQRQLSNFTGADNLQVYWSPEGTQVMVTGVFEGSNKHTYVMPAGGGQPGEIAGGLAETGRGWSKDGRWIYFSSARSGETRLWRISVNGGEAQPITTARADFVTESLDGKVLYFCSRLDGSAVWRMEGGKEIKLFEGLSRRAMAVGRAGIYYITNLSAPVLRYYRFSDGSHWDLLRLEKLPGFGLDVSPDEKTIVFSQFDQSGSDVMMIDQFRMQ